MKKLFIVLFTVFLFSVAGFAQKPTEKISLSGDCVRYLSYYQEDYKAKQYDNALDNLRKAFKACPATASQNMYIHGTTMYTRLYKGTKDENARRAIADTIIALQDKRMAAFPKKRKEILNNKGGYIINYRSKDTQYLFDSLSEIMSENGSESSTTILVNVFDSCIRLYKEGKKTKEEVLDVFASVSDCMDNKSCQDDKEREQLDGARNAVSSLLANSGLADCDILLETLTPSFDANPESLPVVIRIVRLLNGVEGCSSNDLYYRAVTTYHRLDPSYKSAYALYRLNAARGNVQEAVSYLEEAIACEKEDKDVDCRYLNELAEYAYENKLRSKASEVAWKIIELGKQYVPSAYIILGNLWSSAQADDELDRYARFWVAADYYLKAKSTASEGEFKDEKVADYASSRYAAVAKYFPTASDVFMFDLKAGDGYSVTLGGLHARTTVRVKTD